MIRYVIDWLMTDCIQDDLERLAKTEYKCDWQYAYYVLKRGSTPNLEVI